MNNKGFISISVVYSFFLVFLMLLLFIVDGYVNNRTLIKKISERITKDAIATSFCEAHYKEKVCELYPNYDPTANNYNLLYHNFSLETGANDNSYRYSGANPNNYVCFEVNESDCKNNLFRIIGLIPVEVVTDLSSTPLKTEEKVLYKLIKNSIYKTSTMGSHPIYIETGGVISTTTYESNTWSTSALFTNDLNGTYLGSIASEKVANVVWKVGGNTNLTSISIKDVYKKEILQSSYDNTSDGNNEMLNQIGLLYLSDYGFASPSNAWINKLSETNIKNNNWLFNSNEWTITRDSSNRINSYVINSSGNVSSVIINGKSLGVRPVFYLKDNVKIITSGHDGSSDNPYRIS